MMTATKWIETNRSELMEKTGETISNRFKVMLSPYDIPQAVRAYKEHNNAIIEFKYISINETLSEIQLNRNLTLKIGDQTQRIYKIIINEMSGDTNYYSDSALNPESLEEEIDTFISRQENLSKFSTRYSAAKSLLSKYKNQLECELEISE